jgi:hypothetical protein
MIDIIIPTMWMAPGIESCIESYVSHPNVKKVIVVDNKRNKRPNATILRHNKVELISYGRNIYVNPAWNEGHRRTTSNIIAFVNDDILVSHDVLDMVINFDLKDGDLIGVNLRGYQNNYKIDDHINTKEEIVKLNYNKTKPIGGQAWAFGICMFMTRASYNKIPSLYQVWYGDDYLAQRAKNVYAINSNKIKGKISETLRHFNDPNSEISKRIELDSKNFIRFGHFEDGKNWDIPYQMISKQQPVMSTFQLEYERATKTPSDINENVHLLYELAQQCETVVEMGVRTGVSTRAFLNTHTKLISYDIYIDKEVAALFEMARIEGKNAQYIKADVLNIEIDETDLLFIDTLHTYSQLSKELKLHGNKAKKYLAFHDTHTFGLTGEVGNDRKGLMTAIIEFMIDNPHWRFKTHTTNNNGFTILERV